MSRKVIGLLKVKETGMVYFSDEIRKELCSTYPCKLVVEINENKEIIMRHNG